MEASPMKMTVASMQAGISERRPRGRSKAGIGELWPWPASDETGVGGVRAPRESWPQNVSRRPPSNSARAVYARIAIKNARTRASYVEHLGRACCVSNA